MLSDRFYADTQARIANRVLSYSPETAAALHAHARTARAIEINSLFGRAVRALGARLAASFARTPDVATR